MRSALLPMALGDTGLLLFLSFRVGEGHPPGHTGKLVGSRRQLALNGIGLGVKDGEDLDDRSSEQAASWAL